MGRKRLNEISKLPHNGLRLMQRFLSQVRGFIFITPTTEIYRNSPQTTPTESKSKYTRVMHPYEGGYLDVTMFPLRRSAPDCPSKIGRTRCFSPRRSRANKACES